MNTHLEKSPLNSEQKFLFFKIPIKNNYKKDIKLLIKAIFLAFVLAQGASFFSFIKDFNFIYEQNMELSKKGYTFNKIPSKNSYAVLSAKINETQLQGSTEDTQIVLDYLYRSVNDNKLTNNLSKEQQKEMFKNIQQYKYNNIQILEKNFNYISKHCINENFNNSIQVDCILYKQENIKELIKQEKIIIDNKIIAIEKAI